MGAQTFRQEARGKTAQEAFNSARSQAQYEHGHGGYTGTIAEKHSFTMFSRAADMPAMKQANVMLDANDPRINDKYGPAGCIEIEPGRWLFFGWASS